MIIDTSAIVAIFFREDERSEFLSKLDTGDISSISSATLVEVYSVFLRKKSKVGLEELLAFLELFRIEVVDFDREQALIGATAYQRYGRGSQHQAQLNFGDCFSYALAKQTGEPLLFKGNDFSQTDLVRA